MNEKLLSLKDEIKSRLGETKDLTDLDKIRVSYLGKKGSNTALLKGMKDLPNEERKTFGAEVNKLKAQAAQLIEERLQELKEKEIQREIALMPQFDITSPVALARGSYHPITLVQRECEKVFSSMGFNIEDYSEIVTDYECFEALNIPKHHPARDMQDTFYISAPNVLLRSHTSCVQVRTMEKNTPPIQVISPGTVYRVDDIDPQHTPMFYQVEGLVVAENISFANLKAVLIKLLKEVFGEEIGVRFRPSYYPYTEPSAAVDMSCTQCGGKGCRTCGGSGWITVLGSGMVHPNVLEGVGYDSKKYSGFAFGLGLNRLALLYYNLDEIRKFYENDISLWNQI